MLSAIPSSVDLRTQADTALVLRKSAQKALAEVKAEVQRLENEAELLDLVCELIRRLIDQEVTAGVKAVETLQSEGLQAVFDDQILRVQAEVETLRGKISVNLITQHEDGGNVIEGSPEDAFGGAVLTVQSILLRIIVVLRRGLRPFLVLDESLPAFDNNYVVNMGRFLTALTERLGVDILMVTHNQALVEAADRAYHIVRKDGVAEFKVTR